MSDDALTDALSKDELELLHRIAAETIEPCDPPAHVRARILDGNAHAAMIASDSDVAVFGRANPHPRAYGTFVRVLGRYVRELKVLTLEDAVRKMTSLPAQRLGLTDRGVLREGSKADLTVFDPNVVRDLATFDQPHQYAEGVALVVVNGEVVFENGAMTGKRPGRVLSGPALAR